MAYTHTQRAPLHWLLWITAALLVLLAAVAPADAGWVRIMLAVLAAPVVLLAFCFQTLTVSDDGDALAIRFGPLALFQRRVPYATIRTVTPARSAWIDGWGVHWIPVRGWTWNLWGRDCVELMTDAGRLRVGTNDRAGLAAFLEQRIGNEAA